MSFSNSKFRALGYSFVLGEYTGGGGGAERGVSSSFRGGRWLPSLGFNVGRRGPAVREETLHVHDMWQVQFTSRVRQESRTGCLFCLLVAGSFQQES